VPLLDLSVNPQSRIQIFLRVQAPFVVGLLYVVGAAVAVEASAVTRGLFLGGLAVGSVATLLTVLVPWEDLPRPFLLCVPVLDIVAVALLHAEVVPAFPAVSVVAIFPLLWAAYAFGVPGLLVAVAGSVFIVGYRFLVVGALPATLAEWINATTLPLVILGLSIVAFFAARRFRDFALALLRANQAQSRALEAAQDAETLVLGILDRVDAAVCFFDADGRLEVANTMANQMAEAVGFRLDAPPYSGENVLAADRATRIPPDEQLVPRALRGEVIRGHLAWVGPPEAQVAVLASANRLTRKNGSTRGTVVVVHDVTELADAIDVREQFLRTVSHELRTPLTGVIGFLSLVEDAIDPRDTKTRQYIEVVMRRADDLLARISDLVVATDDGLALRLTDLDLREILDAATRRAETLAESRAMTLEVACAADLRLRADSPRIVNAIAELVTNAVKFGAAGSRVMVHGEVAEGRARVSVSNEGPGMTHTEQRRVFDRFYRTPRARSSAIQGYGLGLTTVRSIVRAHDGCIGIESVPEARTTITVDLPVSGPGDAGA